VPDLLLKGVNLGKKSSFKEFGVLLPVIAQMLFFKNQKSTNHNRREKGLDICWT
jgi:hypothetical protein